jgi:hypothetical protein
MENEVVNRLARIEEKLDVIAPHFSSGGSMDKLVKLRAEFDIAKKVLGALWAGLVAWVSFKTNK